MNRIEKGKKQLIWLSVLVLVLSVGIITGGVFLIVSGATDIYGGGTTAISIVLKIVGGTVLFCGGGVGLALGIMMLWTGGVLKATQGSIAEDNLGIGTVNMMKCSKCGCEAKAGETFCGSCGNPLSKTKKCECGTENTADKKFCSKCGKAIK